MGKVTPADAPGPQRESILAGTKPGLLSRKIRLAIFDIGVGRRGCGFPWAMWGRGRK